MYRINNAFKVAKTQGLKTILLSGETGGKLKALQTLRFAYQKVKPIKHKNTILRSIIISV